MGALRFSITREFSGIRDRSTAAFPACRRSQLSSQKKGGVEKVERTGREDQSDENFLDATMLSRALFVAMVAQRPPILQHSRVH